MSIPLASGGSGVVQRAASDLDGAATGRRPAPSGGASGGGPAIAGMRVAAYSVPTDSPESDGTLEWDRTVLVVATIDAGGERGLGYSYASPAAALLAARTLEPAILGLDAFDTGRCWRAMVRAVRNIGRPGIASTAISAVDIALWDLKARLLSVSLMDLLGRTRDAIPAYGSGGFTSYDDDELAAQLRGWVTDGFEMVKMKIGRDQGRDPHRVELARAAIGPDVALFVDANGAYDRKGALSSAARFAELGVTWFEEPVSSDDLEGLRLIRDRAPASLRVAAGEYGWDADTFRRLLAAGAVDVLQADASRCLGITGFIAAASLCEAFHVPLSTHCAPAIHAHLGCAIRPAIHLEWFHDHARIEGGLFDGAPTPIGGQVAPDRSRAGLGIELRENVAAPYRIWQSW